MAVKEIKIAAEIQGLPDEIKTLQKLDHENVVKLITVENEKVLWYWHFINKLILNKNRLHYVVTQQVHRFGTLRGDTERRVR